MSENLEKEPKTKQVEKLTIVKYLNTINVSDRDVYAYTKAYAKEKPKTAAEWSNFLKK